MKWQPSKFIVMVAGLHVLAITWLLLQPENWLVVLLFLLVLHVLVGLLGMLPRSQALGDNLTQFEPEELPGRICLTLDDGPDPRLTPQILQILAKYQVKVTFFCIGRRVEQYPEVVRQIQSEGHQVENHGYAHRVSNPCSGLAGWKAEIQQGADAIFRQTAIRPTLYRPMAGLRNPFLDPVLQRLSVKQVTWSRRAYDTREKNPTVVLDKLTRDLVSGEILLMHDGHAANDANGSPVILSVLPSLIESVHAKGFTFCTLAEAFEIAAKADEQLSS
ncbi:polysaccharide deacetylase family protein [Leeia sp. TBRC 13508]|uniref:Polysaccharide deacetylase family protein n=1 Tax=Leeia speluncae TaxID=2884804 RepID=A0ABS8D4L2_9NEIS|nr:polysaccharide deacetylase family protein [Leeia speluncae]MCB6182906.1 polysaccharide deacetylase family protein [Leeia speluncae]